jgi:hypothetical protein
MAAKKDRLTVLRDELGELPPGLDRLTAVQADHLASLIHAARERQAERLAEGAAAALSVVPRPLRGPVRKALGV